MGFKDFLIKQRNRNTAIREFMSFYENYDDKRKGELYVLFVFEFIEEYIKVRKKYASMNSEKIIDVVIFNLMKSFYHLKTVTEESLSDEQKVEILGLVFGNFLATLSYGLVNKNIIKLSRRKSNSIITTILQISVLLKKIKGFRKDFLSERIKDILKENRDINDEQHELLNEIIWVVEK